MPQHHTVDIHDTVNVLFGPHIIDCIHRNRHVRFTLEPKGIAETVTLLAKQRTKDRPCILVWQSGLERNGLSNKQLADLVSGFDVVGKGEQEAPKHFISWSLVVCLHEKRV
jgi:hypothetical protein